METSRPNQTPLVSIVIPAYNTAHLIADCLESAFSQTYQDFEAVVVNDGSPDTPELERVLEPYLDRIVYLNQENKGAAGARNTAIRKARGEFLAFLDSDDTWLPEHLASSMELFAEDPKLDLVYANGWVIAPDGQEPWEYMKQCPSHGEATFEALVYERCQVSISTVVARKGAIVRAGLFDEGLRRCDDYDMWLRTAFHGGKIGYTRRLQARFNIVRPGSLGASDLLMSQANRTILERLLRTLPLDQATRDLVRQRWLWVNAMCLLREGRLQLSERQFDKAAKSLAEANEQLRSPKIRVALAGIRVAPNATRKVASLWQKLTER
ncbi:MAG TPA: glycosyltransferase family A protein [Terriglobia bacterium]|nr:glycosyltransferase family A protein [Terriglobia bacterium]